MKHLLTTADLRNVCNADSFKNSSGSELQFSNSLMGQERAENALKLGISIRTEGFNIFAAGIAGTGKLTAVKKFVDAPASSEPIPFDWCYVNNFKDSFQPTRLCLSAGKGIVFKKEMKDLIQEILHNLIKAFESEEYANRKKKIVEAFEQEQEAAIQEINKKAQQENFLIKQTPWEIITVPLVDGQPLTDKQFNELPEDRQQVIRVKQDQFLDEIKEKLGGLRKQEKEVNKELTSLEKEVAEMTLKLLIDEISVDYKTLPDVLVYFQEVKNDILENLGEFLISQKKGAPTGEPNSSASFLKRYEVNVLVDNSDLKGAPVIIEANPTYTNLLGRVEKESYMGTLMTDFTMIRKGSLHSANGGYLIVRVEELLQNYFSWHGVKRALKNKEILIEEPGEQIGLLTTKTLKPAPIPLNVKVILIGHPMYYHLLYAYEPDFRGLFKVKADFDSEMERSEKNVHDYVAFVHTTCSKEQLLLPDSGAMARVVEHGSRLVSDQHKMSTRFSEIADVIHEANHYAMQEHATVLTEKHITKAIEEKVYRSSLLQEKINEMIVTNQIFIDIKGAKVGQVNGLSVLDLGDLAFGKPNRITCSVNIGKDGIVAIEREAEMSGPIHTKGVMILTGYLSEKFMQEKPMSLSARIVFEQSYAEVEGDSASAAELYCIMSSLANLPVKQGIAITGSVNQKGEIQPIGGVNEKIEGYFAVCKQIGFNGEQGVMIPAANLRNLMLKQEVLDAVEAKQFTLWAVDTIDEGIEILTGVKAGPVSEAGTVNYLVANALNAYADKMRSYATEEEEEAVGASTS